MRGVASHLVELLAQELPGLPEQGFDLRTECIDIGLRIVLRRVMGRDGGLQTVKVAGLDVPNAALVSRAGDRSVPDRP